MPSSRPKPSEVATEAKRKYIPAIREGVAEEYSPISYLIADSSVITCPPPSEPARCSIAILEADPVDVALEWAESEGNSAGAIPVISMANEQRPGGDWESGMMAQEECLCRRSNLYATLTTPGPGSHHSSNYPIPSTGGIYSPNVVVFRSGPDRYQVWDQYKVLPIISVSPVRRPKLDPTHRKYAFDAERELMCEKIKTCLRIAVYYGFTNLCLGGFGLGNNFRNPTKEVALMWRTALFCDNEFRGHFSNVVFAFDGTERSSSGSSSSSNSKGKSKSVSSSSKTDIEIWREVFDPTKIANETFRS